MGGGEPVRGVERRAPGGVGCLHPPAALLPRLLGVWVVVAATMAAPAAKAGAATRVCADVREAPAASIPGRPRRRLPGRGEARHDPSGV